MTVTFPDPHARSARSQAAARLEFRACTRSVLRRPDDLAAHAERLGVALELQGSEPVQGVLADLFHGCQHGPAEQRRAALASVRPRLNPTVARWFDDHVDATPGPGFNRLATRWSVLAPVSLDGPRRLRRCSTDDSVRLAQAAVQAWLKSDAAAQGAFLEHCRICRDGFAFMLARRAILRSGQSLPEHWRKVFHLLQASACAR